MILQKITLNTKTVNSNKAWIAGITGDMAKIVVKHTMTGFNPVAVHASFSIKPLYTTLNNFEIIGHPHKNGQSSYEKSFQSLVSQRHQENGEDIAFIPGNWQKLNINVNPEEDVRIGILTIKKDGTVYLYFPQDDGTITNDGSPLVKNYKYLTESSKTFITTAKEAMQEIYPQPN